MQINKKSNIIAAVWGFAEATFFFIVPDVYISYRAIKGYKVALYACVYTLVGALIGGSIMFFWSSQSYDSAINYIQHAPGITDSMISQANTDLANEGTLALLKGPVQGIPYKLYAVLSPQYGITFIAFIAISALARMTRFLIAALVVATLSKLLDRWLHYSAKIALLIVFWVLFYSYYVIYIYKLF